MNTNFIQNQLIYTTVRIIATDGKTASIGTGFFIQQNTQNGPETFLATNKHVVGNYDNAEIIFCAQTHDQKPDDNAHVKVPLTNLQNLCIKHPDLDICLINTKAIREAAQGNQIFFMSIGKNFFLSNEIISEVSAIEDIITIGYPEGLMDSKNNKPVVRKGLTATSLSLDFDGRKEFLIDAACFHGCSGSPVFLDRTGLHQEQTENGITIDVKHIYSFIGMLRAIPSKTVKGDIKIVDVPTSKKLISEAELMTNLGFVIKSDCIAEMIDKITSQQTI